MNSGAPRLGAEDVIRIASKLTAEDGAFVVGGQAVNLWAWIYRDRHPYLRPNGPFTSQDIDYFGTAVVAARFAAALGGVMRRPDGDAMNTPQTAIVEIIVAGQVVTIDFLDNLLGIARTDLETGVSVITLPAQVDGRAVELAIPVLHSLLCLQSRIGNMLRAATRRRDPLARRQFEAAVAVLEVYLDEALTEGELREVSRSLRALVAYLRSHEFSRIVDIELGVDPLAILGKMAADERLDRRYRHRQLAGAIADIERRRAARDARRHPAR